MPNNAKKLTKEDIVYKEKILTYRSWLHELKILDPACGSGAFLNQALEFLIKEHTFIRDLLLPFQDLTLRYEIEKDILENNLYGVDINEDAVEIARLSLWLRTAHKGRELTSLAEKIVCANSLLHMPFEENYFDVVIGNPPYVGLNKVKDVDYSKFEVYEKTGDILALFIEKSIYLCKANALMSFIVSNSWLKTKYGESLKKFLEKNGQTSVINFIGTQLFEDATVESCIVNFTRCPRHPELDSGSQIADRVRNDARQPLTIKNIRNFDSKTASIETLYNALENSSEDESEPLLMQKVESIGTVLKEWDIKINYGIKTGFNEAFIIDGAKKDELIAKDKKSSEIIKPLLRGRDIQKYELDFADKWLINSHNNPPINIDDYGVIKEHFYSYYEKLEKRLDKGKTPYNLRNCAYIEDFLKPKIVWGEISDKPKFAYDNGDYFIEATSFIMTGESLKYLLAFLNSKLSKWYFERISTTTGMGTSRWKKFKLELLPIAKIQTLAIPHANISKLLQLQSQKRYDKEAKIKVASHNEKDIFITEFLFAKNRGMIEDLRGHGEIHINYFRLLPFIFSHNLFDEIYQNLDNHRIIYSIFDGENRRIFHVLDEEYFLVSIYVISEDRFKRQINKKFKFISNLSERAVISSILSPAGPFWRQIDLIEELYTHFAKNHTTQEDFIVLVDAILESKSTIKKYKKHFESLNAVDKIEIKEAIEKLENIIATAEITIDKMVYKLYGLSDEEIGIVEEN